LARKALLQPAHLILRQFEILDFSVLRMLSAVWRGTARLLGPLSGLFLA
jgi:hypothetical protein